MTSNDTSNQHSGDQRAPMLHTPGPWEAEIPKPAHRGYYAAGDRAAVSQVGSVTKIATLSVFNDNWRANARLIAAAPELFAFANHPVMEWLLTEGLEHLPEPQLSSIKLFLVDSRKAAIAKATGAA